jgi:hypothetical protein
MKLAAAAVLMMATAAMAQEPSAADIVQKARAVMDKKPQEAVVCRVTVDTQLLDKKGQPEHDEHREGKATLKGGDQDIESEKVVRDGKPVSADEIAEERAKVKKDKARKKKDEDFDLSPLAPKNAPNEAFELVRKETLWGRPAYVLAVKAQKKSPNQANGTLWIDAERFVELKGDLTPSEMPEHADWIKVQEQFVPGPRDLAVPSYLHIEGAGHMLFMHKQFRTTLRWSDCR